MFRRIEFALIFVLFAAPASAHEPVSLDARLATPGFRIEVSKVPSNTFQGTQQYRLHAAGFPRGVVFNVWAKDFGHSFHEVISGFQVDESGNLVLIDQNGLGRPRPAEEIDLGPGPYPRGVGWEVALVSADRTIKTFAKVIPYPLNAQDGACSIELELVSQFGERFLTTGEGFPRGTDVITKIEYAGRLIEKPVRISGEGKLPSRLISHAATNAERSARYTVKGRSCEVRVDYEWGEPALIRR